MAETVRARTARKRHTCMACEWPSILPGHRYEVHTAFPGNEYVETDRPMQAKRCISCAVEAGIETLHQAKACGTYCHGVTPCARPFGHVGDCSCKVDAGRRRGGAVMNLTATAPLPQDTTPDSREAGLAVIKRCIPAYAAGMHAADLAELKAEAARLEALPKSRVNTTMRLIVDAELASRAIADHKYRPLNVTATANTPCGDRPCAYAGCGQPRAEHTQGAWS